MERFSYFTVKAPIHRQSQINMVDNLIRTDDSKTTILIRLMVGAVFLSEGIQKFLFPGIRGAGRFEKIGLPFPEFFGSFVGSFEIVCGALVLIGLLTRFASVPSLSSCSLPSPPQRQKYWQTTDFGKCCTEAGPIGLCCWGASFF